MTSLTKLEDGINRLRVKGGANPESLYELTNGYITNAKTIKGRAGTVVTDTVPAGCVGLCVYQSKLTTFHPTSATGATSTLAIKILRHPTDSALTLKYIHFAEPFVGYLYVVAEYSDSSVHHFWLQASKAWTANTAYKEGDVVEPTTPNGYAYKTVRLGTPLNKWSPLTARALTNVVVPTTSNGFKYTVTAVTGSNPSSGTTEPIWVAENGAIVIEGNAETTGTSTDSGTTTGGSTTGGGGSVNVPPDVIDRYEIPVQEF